MIQQAIKPTSILDREFNLLIDQPMKDYTSFSIGGPADLMAFPENKFELKNLLLRACKLDIPVTIVGGGTNLLITDKGIRGLVIMTQQLNSKIKIIDTDSKTKTFFIGAGVRLSKACRFAINNSLTGLEFAAGIPGTIGGAIKMNAGTKKSDMSSVIESIETLDKTTFEIQTITRNSLNFSYRHLDLSKIIISAIITLKKGNQKNIEKIFNRNLIKKNTNQPVSFANAGCFFKNPTTGKAAGELIEKSGLKGFSIKNAMVSEKHANFIVNIGNARFKDVVLLKQHIQKTVFDKFNVQLEPEVRIEGE